ncbi:MAG: hypothetical protein AB8B72_00975 [Crocinitomicaceae bacterium]
MKNITFLAVALLFSQLIVFGQDTPKVVVFNSPQTAPQAITESNVIKFGALAAVSGDFSFYYERIIDQKFGLELGLGVTLSDYVSSLLNDNIDVFNDNYIPRLGNAFSIGGKYFPDSSIEDFYFGLDFKHKTYNNDRKFNSSAVTYQEKRSVNAVRLSFGYNYFIDRKIILDFFGGFGIGSISQTSVAEELVFEGNTSYIDYVTRNESRLAPRVHIGFKIGVVF